LTAQITNNKLDGDVWLNDDGNVEMTPEAAIDKSKILSDWVRQNDTLKIRENQLRKKDSIITQMSLKVAEMTGELRAANNFIEKQTEKVDEISDDQIDIAKGMFSDFQIDVRGHGNLTSYMNPETGLDESGAFKYLQADIIFKYNIKKWYIFTQGSIGMNDYNSVSLGGGYRLW
jgi:acylphosphatase